ncbi:MAG: ABC transporter permease [Candidatus Neomarinimicrobiota bacterium]
MFGPFWENIRISFSSILANKSRSILSVLGIVIGVLSVTLMGTMISGLDSTFEKSMSNFRSDILFVSRMNWFGGEWDWWELRNRPKIKEEYGERLRFESQFVQAVAPTSERGGRIIRKDRQIDTRFFGTTPEYLSTNDALEIVKGRFFSQGEHRSGARVLVIGADIEKALFEDESALEKFVKIGNHKFRVIGVTGKMGSFMGLFSLDNQAIIPLETFRRLFSRRGWMNIRLKVDGSNIDEAKEEIRGHMRVIRRLKPSEDDNFAINHSSAFESEYNSIKYAIGGTGLFITALSLIVGGIGIMNIMFVSVKERTREIGVRKALGATQKSILIQFLMEAITICFMGGLFGLTVAYGLSMMINRFFPSVMPLGLALSAILLSVIIGIISGLIPASRAAKLDPIEALRYE